MVVVAAAADEAAVLTMLRTGGDDAVTIGRMALRKEGEEAVVVEGAEGWGWVAAAVVD